MSFKVQSFKVLTIITGYKEELVTIPFDKIMQLENEMCQIMRDGPRESHSMTEAETGGEVFQAAFQTGPQEVLRQISRYWSNLTSKIQTKFKKLYGVCLYP